ncbi:MAG: hypothetical protein DI629_16125 [Mesorhizobium amorphae]|nr:MAG: hypothetical protein DI629_16125 [Mesorhizobium amorphae]
MDRPHRLGQPVGTLNPFATRAIAGTGVVLLSVLMVALAPDLRETAPAASTAPLPTAEDTADMEAVLGDEEAPESETRMERLPPRPPLSAPAEPRGPEPTLLYQPVATAAGRLQAGGHLVEIAGVTITEPEARCEGSDGSEWACGAVARTAFRNWLRGRAVLCTVAPEATTAATVTSCTVGREDAGEWLARNGFAQALMDSDYAEAGREAEEAKRGIFGTGQ